MGWDVEGTKGKPEDRDVIVERSLDDETGKKFVDYTFRIHGRPQFLVEAKKPAESLQNKSHIFQAKSYAFSAGVPFVVLTNFREFRLYMITVKPLLNQPDTDLVREFDLTFSDYGKASRRLWEMFARENVAKGSLAKLYLDSLPPGEKPDLNYIYIKGNSLLNQEFLRDLLAWRKLLANDVARRNHSFTAQQINEVVQRTLDRIIFVRILEDRGIEGSELLRAALAKHNREGGNLKRQLDSLYVALNSKYNGLLFHRHLLSERAVVSDGVLRQLIAELYYPLSPYNFKEITVEILGRIFEQYLAVTLRRKRGGIALDLKPELKKGEGAYYTPHYIVSEIVDGCLGQLSDNRQTLTVLDPACGSGSFLINAFKALIRRHEQYYVRNSAARKEGLRTGALVKTANGLQLTASGKKTILSDCIFGVDLDPQAVEIAKMSLYIAMLEAPLDGLPKPALPDLQDNINCGNSIVDSDYYANYEHNPAVDPFDWEARFPEIIRRGGFDCIVGNPPYIRIQTFERINPKSLKRYIADKYQTARQGNFDISIVFVEKALSLLGRRGVMGMILPNKFLTSEYGTSLRQLISAGGHLRKLVYFGDQQVFDGSTTYTCILFLGKERSREYEFLNVADLDRWREDRRRVVGKRSSKPLGASPWHLGSGSSLARKLAETQKLGDIARVFVGLQTDCDEVFLVSKSRKKGRIEYCKSESTGKVHPFEANHLKKVVKGSVDIERYACADRLRLVFPYELGPRRPPLISPVQYRREFPNTWKYLLDCKKRLGLGGRRRLKGKWYGYIYKKNHARFEQPKILVPSLCRGSRFALDREGTRYFVGSGIGGGGGYGIVLNEEDSSFSLLSLLGILNSRYVNDWIVERGSPFSGGWIGIDRRFIDSIPIPVVKKTEAKKLEALKQLERYVQAILRVQPQPNDDSALASKGRTWVEGLQGKIDRIVAELYGVKP